MSDSEPRPQSYGGNPGSVPVPVGEGSHAMGRPLEGIAAALKMQAEILKGMHDRQARLEDSLTDQSRSDIMIRSTRSLNESFRGMRRVQEKLLDELGDRQPRRSWAPFFLVLGLLAVGGAIVWATQTLGGTLEEQAEIARKSERVEPVVALVKSLEDRVRDVEGRDLAEVFRELRGELSDLRPKVEQLTRDNDTVRTERDQAREELGAVRVQMEKIQGERETAATELQQSREEVGRLTKDSLAQQQLVTKLNDTVAGLRHRLDVGVNVAPIGVPPEASKAVPAIPETPAPLMGPPLDAGQPIAGTPPPDAPEPTATSPNRRTIPITLLNRVNELLSRHRGSERYVLTKAVETDGQTLYDIELEVHGADGKLAKTVEAQELDLMLVARRGYLELEFRGGAVSFAYGISRRIKSPFFNNKYQIVVLGIETQDWMTAGFPFLRVK